MSYEIKGVGQYNYVPATLLNRNHNLARFFSEAIFSPTAERLLLRKTGCNTLYSAGGTDDPEDLLFVLNESMELGGINLPQVIPVGDGTHNIIGFIRLPGIYPPAYPEDEFGLFLEMDMTDFPKLVEKGVTSVLIDQFTNVVFMNKEGETGLIRHNQIEIPSYTRKRVFIPNIITDIALKGEDKEVKVELSQHYTGLVSLSFT